MSKQSASPKQPPRPPPHLVGRALYGEAFEGSSPGALGASIADWEGLTSAERSFTLAHLLYLNLQGQGRILQTQLKASRLLGEVAEDLADVMASLTEPGGGEGQEDEEEDEGAGRSA